MNYHAYKKENGRLELIEVRKVKNKLEMREKLLTSKNLHLIEKVEYGRRSYTMSDVYAGR